uniref:Uncharacterized protein n=1 Tax=Arundo donax TaxID=35708 RepID=A0A0A9FQF7_ARUDO
MSQQQNNFNKNGLTSSLDLMVSNQSHNFVRLIEPKLNYV